MFHQKRRKSSSRNKSQFIYVTPRTPRFDKKNPRSQLSKEEKTLILNTRGVSKFLIAGFRSWGFRYVWGQRKHMRDIAAVRCRKNVESMVCEIVSSCPMRFTVMREKPFCSISCDEPHVKRGGAQLTQFQTFPARSHSRECDPPAILLTQENRVRRNQ